MRGAQHILLSTIVLVAVGCDDCGEEASPELTPPSSETATEGAESESATDESIAARCAEARTRAEEILGEHASLEGADVLGHCIGESEGGAWILMPIAATSEEREGEDPYGNPGDIAHGTATTIRYRVTFLAPGGETIEEESERTFSRDTFDASSQSVQVQHAFDYDGDGRSEVILLFNDFVYEDSDYSQKFWTIRDGAIRDYAPADGIDVASLVDRDGDGRMDIVSAAKFYGEPAGANGDPIGNPEVLFHSLPDGTFTPSDEVAASFLRERCPAPPATLIADHSDLLGAELSVTCATLWGANAADLHARIDAELEGVPERDRAYLADALHASADIEPVVLLGSSEEEGTAPTGPTH